MYEEPTKLTTIKGIRYLVSQRLPKRHTAWRENTATRIILISETSSSEQLVSCLYPYTEVSYTSHKSACHNHVCKLSILPLALRNGWRKQHEHNAGSLAERRDLL